MSGPETTPSGDDQLLKEAAAWFARMRGPEAEAAKEEFEAWLRRGALHRSAYNRVSEIFAMGKLLGDADSSDPSGRIDPARPRRKILAALAMLVALATVTWLALGATLDPNRSGDVIAERPSLAPENVRRLLTGPGESRSARLEDGSLVRLETGTTLDVRFDRSERHLSLERGLARFEVAHEARPFVVHAGGGRITALGTLFDVEIEPNRRVTVRLIRGSVEVTPPARQSTGAPRPAPRRLRAGETMSFAAGADANPDVAASRPVIPYPIEPPATLPGVARDYDNVAVAELIAAANRGTSRPIRLSDPAIGARRISGRFRIDDTLVLAERLARLFDLALDRDEAGGIILRPR